MTQEAKDLLLKDLCARLPYGVKVQVDLQSDTYSPIVCKVCSVECAEIGSTFIGVETSPDTYNEFREFLCKPYLFPLSSMTKEQKSELSRFCDCPIYVTNWDFRFPDYVHNTMNSWEKAFTWLNKHHFDYRGLIEQGLAIDATGLNIY